LTGEPHVQQTRCHWCGCEIENRSPREDREHWVHMRNAFEVCFPDHGEDSPTAMPAEEQSPWGRAWAEGAERIYRRRSCTIEIWIGEEVPYTEIERFLEAVSALADTWPRSKWDPCVSMRPGPPLGCDGPELGGPPNQPTDQPAESETSP
jgi:hypothetical protein